jgi:ABC-type uncharacterized transport system involved in gliding motility auxiliary subunit
MKLFAKQSSSSDGRVFRSGVWSAAIAAAVIVLAVLVNLIVRAIPSRYTEFDLSEAGLYTLSESSRQVADDLTQDVTIYYLAQTGNEDQIISKLLDKYAAQSSHITWELKDPAVYPTFAAQYGAQELTSGGLILVCGEQSKVLDAAELYDYDYSDYAATGAANVTFDGESRITSAIYQLTSGESRHVYYTTNHGEQALTSTLTDALESQNLTVSALDLLSQTIPEDCDLLVINDPAQDFSGAGSLVDELGQLRSYLSSLVGMLTAICAIIPYVGALISCVVSVFLVLLVDPVLAVRCLIVYLAVQFIENQFIYPRVVGKSVGLSPLYTLVAAMIGGKLFGIIGIIFFIPLTAVIIELVKEDACRRIQAREPQ